VTPVNISTEKWPPRHRTYFGYIQVRSPGPGEPFAITPIRGCQRVMPAGINLSGWERIGRTSYFVFLLPAGISTDRKVLRD
jgi:hypothetical protein